MHSPWDDSNSRYFRNKKIKKTDKGGCTIIRVEKDKKMNKFLVRSYSETNLLGTYICVSEAVQEEIFEFDSWLLQFCLRYKQREVKASVPLKYDLWGRKYSKQEK